MSRFRFSHQGLMCDAYENKNETANKVALYLYGFPATIGESPATKLLASQGYLVVQPHYPGTYDSTGKFSPHTASEAVQTVANAFASGVVMDVKKNTSRNVPKNIVVCLAYSFGSIIALRSLSFLPDLRSLLLFSPAITYGEASLPSGFRDKGKQFMKYLRRSRPYTYRLGDDHSWDQLFNGSLNKPVGSSPKSLEYVLGVVGGNDEWFDHAILNRNFEPVIRRYVGDAPKVNLVTIESGNHGIGTLVDPISSKLVTNIISGKIE